LNSKEDDPLLSTTTAITKIRGFSIELLYLLRERPMTTPEMTELTGKSVRYVSRYLYNMRKYGLLEKNGYFWKITELGVSFLNFIERRNKQIKIKRKKYERKTKEKQKRKCQKMSLKASFRIWLEKYQHSLSEEEVRIVEVLLEQYDKTGSPFIFCPKLEDAVEYFKIGYLGIHECFRKLKQEGVAWVFPDKTYMAYKIGLYKKFIDQLKKISEIYSETKPPDRAEKLKKRDVSIKEIYKLFPKDLKYKIYISFSDNHITIRPRDPTDPIDVERLSRITAKLGGETIKEGQEIYFKIK